MVGKKTITLFDFFKKILTADLVSLFLDLIFPEHCKSHDKSLKFSGLDEI